jgi:hypothetical protein
MPSTASDAWAVWIVIILFLVACIAIFIWIAIDSTSGPPAEHITFETLTNTK